MKALDEIVRLQKRIEELEALQVTLCEPVSVDSSEVTKAQKAFEKAALARDNAFNKADKARRQTRRELQEETSVLYLEKQALLQSMTARVNHNADCSDCRSI